MIDMTVELWYDAPVVPLWDTPMTDQTENPLVEILIQIRAAQAAVFRAREALEKATPLAKHLALHEELSALIAQFHKMLPAAGKLVL